MVIFITCFQAQGLLDNIAAFEAKEKEEKSGKHEAES